jgi:hypothetical protein
MSVIRRSDTPVRQRDGQSDRRPSCQRTRRRRCYDLAPRVNFYPISYVLHVQWTTISRYLSDIKTCKTKKTESPITMSGFTTCTPKSKLMTRWTRFSRGTSTTVLYIIHVACRVRVERITNPRESVSALKEDEFGTSQGPMGKRDAV